MTERLPLRIAIDVEPETDPIKGSITVDGDVHRFTGWLEVIAAIEAARTQAPVTSTTGS